MKKIFTLCAVALATMSANAENHALKLTQASAKANPWDTQVFINIKNLEVGKPYTISLDVKSDGESFKYGSETIDDAQSSHKSEWGASAVFAYTEENPVAGAWATGTITATGKTTVTCHSHCTAKEEGGEISHNNGSTSSCNAETLTNFEYAATAILLNVGKTVGAIYIDNIVVKDSEGTVVYTQDFESDATAKADDKSASAYFPAWQNAAWSIVEVEGNATSIDEIAETNNDSEMYNLLGQRVTNAKGLVIINGKKVIRK